MNTWVNVARYQLTDRLATSSYPWAIWDWSSLVNLVIVVCGPSCP